MAIFSPKTFYIQPEFCPVAWHPVSKEIGFAYLAVALLYDMNHLFFGICDPIERKPLFLQDKNSMKYASEN